MKSVDGGCSPSGADQDADRFKAPVPLFGFESAIQNPACAALLHASN